MEKHGHASQPPVGTGAGLASPQRCEGGYLPLASAAWKTRGGCQGSHGLRGSLLHFKSKSNQITFIVTSPQHKCLGE